jgi:uncharacterized protein (TIGR03032 family)
MTPSKTHDAWSRHAKSWRHPGQVIGLWETAGRVDPQLHRHRVTGAFWQVLADAKATLLVSREYEHLLMGLCVDNGRPCITYQELPHPSGIAVDRRTASVTVASTRNPNQLIEFRPVDGLIERDDVSAPPIARRPLIPVRSTFFPGSLYIHDLAYVGRRLYASAVGHNAVTALDWSGEWRNAWWPRSIERDGKPDFSRNYLQLNSIAAGRDLQSSFFSASAERPSARRPGQLNFPVDRRGVIFSGRTREPLVRGLTRPHSARLHQEQLWIANSGYGELATVNGGELEPVARLRGWTRGLCFLDGLAFVGTSRVIPRFRAYAPGLEVDESVCGVHAVDLSSGRVVGSLSWPAGNQIFAIEWIHNNDSLGFAFDRSRRSLDESRRLFYAFGRRKPTTEESTA